MKFSKNTRRVIILLVISLPVLAIFILFAWAINQTGGQEQNFIIDLSIGKDQTEYRAAPEIKSPSIDGQQMSISDFDGKVLMIDFWSTWCIPCRQEAPLLADTYNEYSGQSVEFIGVAVWDDTDKIIEFANEINIPYPIIVDSQGLTAIDYGVVGIPEKYFVDRNGQLVNKYTGPIDSYTLRYILDQLIVDKDS